MKKTAFILIRIFLIFLTISMIDGGKFFFSSDITEHHLVVNEKQTDSEITDYDLSSLWEDLILFNVPVNRPELSSLSNQEIMSQFSRETIDFSGSIWQPPKLL